MPGRGEGALPGQRADMDMLRACAQDGEELTVLAEPSMSGTVGAARCRWPPAHGVLMAPSPDGSHRRSLGASCGPLDPGLGAQTLSSQPRPELGGVEG